MHAEINIRLTSANRCYFALSEPIEVKINIEKTKERLYISYVRPVFCYVCATWATTNDDEEKLPTFERKILRKIRGPMYDREEEKWEIRSNNQLSTLYKGQNVR